MSETRGGPDRVIFVGNPNVGKSLLFGVLTGRYVTVSNYPGTTVEVTRGHLSLDGRRCEAVDTPGTNTLLPQSEDERVTRDLLLEEAGAVLQVGDAKNLPRVLTLSLQLAEAGLPFALCLNMRDEADEHGIAIDAARLAGLLGVDVVETVATRREGTSRVPALLRGARLAHVRTDYGDAIEERVGRVEPLMPRAGLSKRSLALAALAGDATLAGWLEGRLDREALAAVEEARAELARVLRRAPGAAMQETRILRAAELAAQVMSAPGTRGPAGRRRAGIVGMHPLWGLPVVAGVLLGLYLFVGVFGAGTLVGLLEQGLFGDIINPFVLDLFERWSPWPLLTDLVAGPYGLVTMGLTYAIAIVLPIVATFFLAFSILEDSGYLPRLAVMTNKAFRLMGLNGRAVMPMVLGLGCDTMATMTTRILGTRRERLIVILLLALGVPCSAQLGVVLGMLAALSWKATLVWSGVLLAVIVAVGHLASRVIPGEHPDFIMEIPPLRFPSPGNLARKTLARVEWYLREAVPLFLLGTLILFVSDRVGLLLLVQRAFAPVLTGFLGLPAEASEAFVIGFLRRDFGAAGLYRLAEAGMLDPVQVVVSLVTMTLFIPCIASFFMIVKEQGTRIALAVAAFVFPFAILVGGVLNFALRHLGVTFR